MSKTPKTPKTPGKEKKTDAQQKIKYGIFVVNLAENLGPISKQFVQGLEDHQRKAVLGFSRDDVVREILELAAKKTKAAKDAKEGSGKDKKGKKQGKEEDPKDKKGKKGGDDSKGKEKKGADKKKDEKSPSKMEQVPKQEQKIMVEEEKVEPINLQAFVLDDKNFNQFYTKTKERIDKLVKRYETINNVQKNRREFDLLKYWEERGDGIPSNDGDKKGKGKEKAADKKGKKDKEKSDQGADKKAKGADKKADKKDDKKGKKKDEKVKVDDDTGCKLQEVNFVELEAKKWSLLQPRLEEYVIRPRVR